MRLRGVGNVPIQQLCPDNHRGLIRQHLAGGAASAALLTILSGASQGENLSNERTEEIGVMLTSPATCHTWYATAAPATGRLQPAVSALPAPFPQLSPSARQHATADGLGRPQRGTVQGLTSRTCNICTQTGCGVQWKGLPVTPAAPRLDPAPPRTARNSDGAPSGKSSDAEGGACPRPNRTIYHTLNVLRHDPAPAAHLGRLRGQWASRAPASATV